MKELEVKRQIAGVFRQVVSHHFKSLLFSRALRFLILWGVFSWVAGPAFAAEALREVQDFTQTSIRLVAQPSRIIPLAPSLAELVVELLPSGWERIVAVTEFTDFPGELAQKPKVGSYARLNLEAIVSRKPDLVLATLDGNSKDQVQRLRSLGVPVLVVGTSNFEEVKLSIRMVGEALGAKERALALESRFVSALQSLHKRYHATANRPRVLLQIGDDPLVVVGKKSFLQEALEAVGAKNIYSSELSGYPRPSREDVLSKNPEMILILALHGEMRTFDRMADRWRAFPQLAAVREGKVRVLKADGLLRPGSRLIEGLSALESAIHVREGKGS